MAFESANLAKLAPDYTLSGWMLGQVTPSRPDVVLTCREKITTIVLSILFVVPVIVDVAIWALKSIVVYPVYARGLSNHFQDLKALVVLPYLVAMSLFYPPSTKPLPIKQQPTFPPAIAKPITVSPPPTSTQETVSPPQKPVTALPQVVEKPQRIIRDGEFTEAVASGDVAIVRTWLEQNKNAHRNIKEFLSAKSLLEWIPWLASIARRPARPEIVEVAGLLIEHGVNVDQPNNEGKFPLNEAVWNVDLPLTTLLIQKGANTNVCEASIHKYTPLTSAINNCILETKEKEKKALLLVRLLLEHQADPKLCGLWGWTPLHFALFWGVPKVVQLLLDQGVDPVLENGGHIPLLFAVEQPKPSRQAFKALVDKVIETKDLDGLCKPNLSKDFTSTYRSVITMLIASWPKRFSKVMREELKPIDTSVLMPLWKWLHCSIPSNRSGLLNTISDLKIPNDPYLDAIQYIFNQKIIGLTVPERREALRKWIASVATEALTQTTQKLYEHFESCAPGINRDLCRLIARYAQLSV